MSVEYNAVVNLEKALSTVTSSIERFKLENVVFQKYSSKKSVELGPDDDEKRKKKLRKNLASVLTLDQKIDICNSVNDDLQLDIDSSVKNSEKMIDTLRAVLEETEIRIGELKRDAYEFKRDVVVGAENVQTGKIMAERVTRYFENKLKQVDNVIEKLRLKNSTLNNQLSKVEVQLTQKEEAGDVLHYIDFHQLQIENKQYVARIEERNDDLLAVKLQTGKTIQALNEYKKKLGEKMTEENWLKSEVLSKGNLLQKLDGDEIKVGKEVKNDGRQRNRLRQLIEEAAEMPNIEDYISQKKEMYELDSMIANWKKKVEIVEMEAKKARNEIRSLKR